MGLILLLTLIGLPVLEIAVLIEAGSVFGLWPTTAAIILTALIGAYLFRAQGMRIIHELQATVNAGQTPLKAMLDGAGLLIAGTLLFLPGFVTDVLGFILFIPVLRVLLMALVARRILSRRSHAQGFTADDDQGRPGPNIIDAEFTEIKKSSKNNDKET
ncbi:MAG: FxsA family protein [Rhodospirillaceae bacterium]